MVGMAVAAASAVDTAAASVVVTAGDSVVVTVAAGVVATMAAGVVIAATGVAIAATGMEVAIGVISMGSVTMDILMAMIITKIPVIAIITKALMANGIIPVISNNGS